MEIWRRKIGKMHTGPSEKRRPPWTRGRLMGAEETKKF